MSVTTDLIRRSSDYISRGRCGSVCDISRGSYVYQFAVDTTSKPDLYRDLLAAIDAITAGEADGVANMANAAALLWEYLPDLNWAGFYRMTGGELVLGPFQGKAACIRIPVGKGVCGTAAAGAETQLVDDVHAFPGHIACDAASRSELVVPIVRAGVVVAVIDLDAPLPARFDAEDAVGVEAIAAMLAARV
jgi:GAF domain-containing protein